MSKEEFVDIPSLLKRDMSSDGRILLYQVQSNANSDYAWALCVGSFLQKCDTTVCDRIINFGDNYIGQIFTKLYDENDFVSDECTMAYIQIGLNTNNNLIPLSILSFNFIPAKSNDFKNVKLSTKDNINKIKGSFAIVLEHISKTHKGKRNVLKKYDTFPGNDKLINSLILQLPESLDQIKKL